MISSAEIPLMAVQPLPVATRRQIVARLEVFDPPQNWKNDTVFYDWLLAHYEENGTRYVDNALLALGGKNVRRKLTFTIFSWAESQGFRYERDQEIFDQIEAFAITNPEEAQVMSWVFRVAAGQMGKPIDDDQDGEAIVVEGCDEGDLDVQVVLSAARMVLDRAEATASPELLREIAQFTSALQKRMDQRDLDGQRARIATALAALHGAIDRLPETVRAEFVGPFGSGSVELLEVATAAVIALEGAAEREAEATRRLQFGNRSISQRAQDHKVANEAWNDLTKALEEAHRTLAAVALTTAVEAQSDAAPHEAVAPDAEPAEASEPPRVDGATEWPEICADPASVDPATFDPLSDDVRPTRSDKDDGELLTAVPVEIGMMGDAPADAHGTADTALPSEAMPAEFKSARQPDPALDVLALDEVVDDATPLIVADAPDAADALVATDALDDWDRWIRIAIEDGKLGLATHLARARELAGADSPGSWPATLMEGLVYGASVEAGNDRAASRYEELSEELQRLVAGILVDTPQGRAQVLAVIGGALRPCLVANYSGITVINALPTGRQFTGYHELLELLREGPQLGLAAMDELMPRAEASDRDRQREVAVRNLRAWYNSIKTRKMPYQPATALWQMDLIRPDGAIGGVFEATIDGAKDATARAQALVDELRADPEEFLDAQFKRYMKGKGKGLEGIARTRFLAMLLEARDLLEAWLRVERPSRNASDRFDRVRFRLKAALVQAAGATAQLKEDPDAQVRIGAVLLGRVIQGLQDLLDGRERKAADPRQVLDTEIALLPEFPLNGRIGLAIEPEDVVALRRAAELNLAECVPTWADAFSRALALGAPGVARRLAPFIATDPGDVDADIDAVTVKQRHNIKAERQRLRAQLDDLQSAMIGDSLSTEYETMLQELERFDLDSLPCDGMDEPGAIGDFPVLCEQFANFGSQLAHERAQVAAKLEDRIKQLQAKGDSLDDCFAMLQRGDLGTLAEELSQVERFGPDRRADSPASLLRPVDHFAHQVLSQPSDLPAFQAQRLRDAAGSGEAVGPFHFECLPESERSEARQLLDCWVRLKQQVLGQQQLRAQALLQFLGALGFSGVKLAREVNWREGRRFDIKVDPLRSAGDCIVPAFGSQASGSYTVLLMPKGTLEKSLQSGFAELQPPVIALAMEWLTPKARREFLRKSRARPAAAFALLDDPAVAALAATPGRNLRSFFTLAVPFGAARPYSDTGAATSIEMFFGREREYDTLVDPQGSCLVYGGRQLGKTALLKQIELRNHTNPDTVVVYRDIKNVGSSELPGSVWDHIGDGLRDKGVANVEGSRGDRVIDTIRAWLKGQMQRRIIILLDEADNFLESEMESDFPNIMKMKGLMEETGRRVKFVYAGLHNVQRFVRTPNSPMLHLGEPVNIGPLLGIDRHAARQMVFEPMAASGVGFRQPTDAHHMLSLVGYYPSLLQSFGKSLLAHVDEELARKGEPDQMPILLDRKAIEQGFKEAKFSSDLREKFSATLRLDPRYELIAYAVCFKAEEERSKGRIAGHGYANRDIFKLAQEYWPQGFADIRSSETFGAILDEMVGLGVLARHGEGYAIRSARIATMLGDPDQIETHLLEFSDRPRPAKLDPLANHRQLKNGGYSPLSWRHEKALIDQLRAETHPVSLVFLAGSAAVADPEDIIQSLQSLAEMQGWPALRELEFRSVEDLRKVIAAHRREAAPGRPKLIACHGRWPGLDEIAVLDGMKELRDSANPVRIAFIGTAVEQTCGRASAEAVRLLKANMVDLIPWDSEAINHWLLRHARNCAEEVGFAQRVRDETGGFAVVFDEVVLPKGGVNSAAELLDRLAATAEKVLDLGAIGLSQPPLLALARKLAEFDDENGLTDDDVRDLASEIDSGDGIAAITALRNLGLIVQVQTAGEPHWRLLHRLRKIVMKAL